MNSKAQTIKEKYQLLLSKNYNLEDVANFISGQNAELIAKFASNQELPEELYEEVFDFCDLFFSTISEKEYNMIIEMWGREPFIFQFANASRENYEKNYVAQLNSKVKREAESLSNTLWRIRKKRIMSFISTSEDGKNSEMTIVLENTIPRNLTNFNKTHLTFACAKMIISESGGLVVRTIDRKKQIEIFGIRSRNGKWKPISKDEMIYCHTLQPDGSRTAPEKGVIYTELQNIA